MRLPCYSSQNNSCYNKSFWQDLLSGDIKRQGCVVSETGGPQNLFFHTFQNACVSRRPFPWNRRQTALKGDVLPVNTLQKAEGSSVWGQPGCSSLHPGMGSALMCLLHSAGQHPGKLNGCPLLSLAAKSAEGALFLPFVLLQSHSYALTQSPLLCQLCWSDLG